MEALATRSRSYYSSAYFRPVRGTEHILILGRVTLAVLARLGGGGASVRLDAPMI